MKITSTQTSPISRFANREVKKGPNPEPGWTDTWKVEDQVFRSTSKLRAQPELLGKQALHTYRNDPTPTPYSSSVKLQNAAKHGAIGAVKGAFLGMAGLVPIAVFDTFAVATGGLLGAPEAAPAVAGAFVLGGAMLGGWMGASHGYQMQPEQVTASLQGNFVERDGEVAFLPEKGLDGQFFKLSKHEADPQFFRQEFERRRASAP